MYLRFEPLCTDKSECILKQSDKHTHTHTHAADIFVIC